MPKNALYNKFYRFKATSPSTIVELDSSGYGTITPTISGGEIVITSSGEFDNGTWIDDNQNTSAAYVDANTIKFYPDADWGVIVGEIWEYDD